jgi:hypothetical protein
VPQDAVDRLIADRHFGILVSYLRNGDKVYETYWTTGRGNELMAPSYGLVDLTVYGRQEFWEDSPEGWPQRWVPKVASFGWTAARPPSGHGSKPDATTTSARRLVSSRSNTLTEPADRRPLRRTLMPR